MNGLRRRLHPAWYQGGTRRPPYFEGWYYKLVSPGGDTRLALIPGLFKHRSADEAHAFVQVVSGSDNQVSYSRFGTNAFSSAPVGLDIRVAGSRFTERHLAVDVDAAGIQLQGEIHFEHTRPWPVTLSSPGIMGWYAWVPFMQCYHGVVSLDHRLAGSLRLNGRTIDFTGGRGYIEKDWGRSFPACWVWMQTNHFASEATCLTASIAHIPWFGSYFPGFIVGLLADDRLYRFATYTGARTEFLAVTDRRVEWVMRDRKFRLELSARRADAAILFAPTTAEMSPRVAESMSSEVSVRLVSLRDGAPLFEGTGLHAGLEVHGDIGPLMP